ncbi:MAG: signal peptidase I [Erysipelotrichaceae bacterium]|nr:signal peptidase I [Erysipelotrichaceae bacterium]
MEKKNGFIDFLEIIAVSLIVTYLLFNFVLISAVVNGSSMYPTLKADQFGYSFVISRNMKINRFDICVLQSEDKKLVKRVIGLPGETIKYENNVLYINGEVMEDVVGEDVFTSDFEAVLGEDEYYCLGDNREISKDSRFYGAFKKEDIISTHFFVIYPLAEMGYNN